MTTIRRQLKNVVKNYTEAEVKVREATSNDPWGPSSTLMSEISDLTYNIVALGDIMRMIWKRLNDHGKNWRHVYKSLVLLDYLIKNGNEKVAQQCKEHIVAIQTLKDFQYIEENKDQGANVRDKAKQLVSLLRDDDRLKQERAKALKARERYAQTAMGISSDNKVTYQTSRYTGASTKTGGNYSDPYGGAGAGGVGVGAGGATTANPLSPELEAVRPSDPNEEELQVNLALMLSQQEHEEEVKRKRADEAKLALAIEQSKMETSVSPHDDGLLDLASGYSGGAGASNTDHNDPWNDSHVSHNNNNKYNSFQSKPDPWSLNSIPTTTTTTTSTNIFHSNNNNNISNSNNIHKQLEDPWATNHNSNNVWGGGNSNLKTTTTLNNDPWGASEAPINNQQDEFDVFTSKRVTSPVNTFQSTTNTIINTNNDPFSDFFGGGGGSNTTEKKSTNPWSQPTTQTNTNQHQQQQQQQQQHIQNPIRKTPESFLGENSSLVNLDNLIPISNTSSNTMQNNVQQRPKSTNPFNGGPAFSTTPTYTLQTSLSNTNISANTANTATKGPVSNPFMQTQKGPTINQLAQQQQQQQFGISPSSPLTIPSVNSTMMPPLLPTSNAIAGGGGGGIGQPLYPSLVPMQQNYAAASNTSTTNAFNSQQQSTNPFLMM